MISHFFKQIIQLFYGGVLGLTDGSMESGISEPNSNFN